MGCCEGKNGCGALGVLAVAKTVSSRWEPVFRFHKAYHADTWRAVLDRDGIIVVDDPDAISAETCQEG